ncbi:MAG: hypothetical protein JXR89_10695 [Deltaproteobacteria bacterium]|nr:hypothetical protein [Deltaproteobacteria bacterium]
MKKDIESRHKKQGYSVSFWRIAFAALAFVWLPISSAHATSIESACALVLEKLNANLAAHGEIVALLPGGDYLVEFDDLVPTYGAELLVFGDSAELDERADASAGSPIFRGSLTVMESSGHLCRMRVEEGGEGLVVADRVWVPEPVIVYLTPVGTLAADPGLAAELTRALAAQLPGFGNLRVFSLPAVNQTTVDFLRRQCRGQGLYGMLIQPFIIFQNERYKVRLSLTSLFSGQPLPALEQEFKGFIQPSASSHAPGGLNHR